MSKSKNSNHFEFISSNFMQSIYMKRNKTLSKYSKYLKWLIDQLKEFKINKKFVKFQNEFKSYNLKSIKLRKKPK